MNLYYVSFGSNVAGSRDYCYVMAKDEIDAISKAKLDTHKLSENLNKYSRYFVMRV